MVKNFTISAFADEISENVEEQIRVLKETGIHHIEIRGLDGKNVSELTEEEAREYKSKFDSNGIQVSSIGSPIGKIGIKEPFDEHLNLFRHVLKLAEIFEAPYIRMFSFFIEEDEDPKQYSEEVIRRWQAFLDAAKTYENIILLHENEKDIYGDTPERCLHLLETLNSPKVKAAFDPANFVQCDVEVYPKAFDMLAEHIAYMHIKDANFVDHEVEPAGSGDGQVALVLEQLIKRGYQGFASLEPHLSVFTGFAELEKADVSGLAQESDQVKLFHVASEALKTILVDQLEQEWG